MKKISQNTFGFTLVELLLAVLILGFVLIGLIEVFLRCSTQAELAQSKSDVMSLLQGKMEEIRNHDFEDITTDYASGGTPGDTFDLDPMVGKGVVYIQEFTAGEADLLVVKIVGSWEEDNGRIIGGDFDLDGEIDAGETTDAEGDLWSPATIISMVASR